MPERVIIHVDLDYFYAQCEELRKPHIKGKPVAVCIYSGRTAESGAISTSNYPAREIGIKSGMAIFQAKRLAEGKGVVFLPADIDHYSEISERVMAILRLHSDKFEQVSIDEAYLDVSLKTDGSFDYGKEIAHLVKRAVFEKEKLTCSVGIGPNKLIAKMAASVKKPDGLTLITPSKVKEFIEPLPVKKLYGVGPKSEEKLNTIGIDTIGQLSRTDLRKLMELFGEKTGIYFHEAASGIDNEPVEESEREQISRIVTLKENSVDFEVISKEILPMSDEIAKELKKEGRRFRSVGIIAILDDLSTKTKTHTIDYHTDSPEALSQISADLLEEFLKGSDRKLRRFGIKVSGFGEKKEQKDLKSFF